ncbi:type I-U CRISPR-associated helicase/endonuclease Cas3 [Corynebacterium sp.]|uniref:type I-G CRISPR-associated helicase/endonuclease Cas3g n=1 Tax=Corynebacterium sp. TaxID=1720 RepID=UPI0028A831C5|nr:type I-U CRISPR-associated helicase/endonuclease Cas3 [Corynebacterium sp.]
MTVFPTFSEFHTAIHGYAPFRWQEELAASVDAEGHWPDHISAPTGAGKTTTLDIAVWALAKDVHDHGPEHRRLPLRIFLAVERRLVVDSAYDHAHKIAQAVSKGTGPLAAVHRALAILLPEGGDHDLLGVTSLHGARAENRDWLRPVGAQIITCTLTQLSSRVLFRAVGSSSGMLPVHAALTGTDRLILVDEPHLVPAAVTMFRETESLQRRYPRSPRVGQTVVLGATVPDHLAGPDTFSGSLSGDPSEVARKKVSRRIPGVLTTAQTPSATIRTLVNAAVTAWSTREKEGGDGVLVMVNTVTTAQQVYAQVRKSLDEDSRKHCRLLTSTVRPVDREKFDPDHDSLTVATQTLEVGVDLDACALVTELPSMPSLVQRLGRLNRSGDRTAQPAVIVTTLKDGTPSDRATNAIYGEQQMQSTWDALSAAAAAEGPDGTARIEDLLDIPVPEASWEPPPRTTPTAPFLRRLASTRPRADVPWEALAFGPDRRDRATVRVAWRESLDVLDTADIHPQETITLPIGEVRSFLTGTGAHGQFGDTEFGDSRRAPTGVLTVDARVQRDRRWVVLTTLADLRPEDTVALECTQGGYSAQAGWDPTESKKVADLSWKAVLQDGKGRFDATALLDNVRVEEAVEVGEDLEQEIVDSLSRKDVKDIPKLTVQGRFVSIHTPGTGRDSTMRVPLADHSRQVEKLARMNSPLAGLGPEDADVLAQAGLHHDGGKSLPAFQLKLGNTDPENPVAKPIGGQSGDLLSRWRHEVASADGVPDGPRADLVRHLVISHHGWGRPVVPHTGHTVHNGEAYRAVEAEYGPWGTALLETVLRFSDWEASRRPEVPGDGTTWTSTGVPTVVEDAYHPASSETAVPVKADYSLSGPRKHSLMIFFAGVGALAACVEDGAAEARIRFKEGTAELLCPRRPAWDTDRWRKWFQATQVAAGLCSEEGEPLPKNADIQVVKGNKWLDQYRESALSTAPDLLPFLFDAEPAPRNATKETGRFFSAPVHLRNGNPFEAVMGLSSDGVSADALFESSVGLVRGKMNAGLDVSGDIRFTESVDEPTYSADLVAWSIAGMLALDMPATSAGVGVRRGRLRLPHPANWTSLDELRDLVIAAPETETYAVWESTASSNSDQVKQWTPVNEDE